MPNFTDFFRSKDFLAAADLQSRDVSLRIRQVTPETVDGDAGKETALICYFDKTQKKLRLNRTNANMIAQLTGTQDFDRWVGTTITLYPTPVEFRGTMRDAIRIRPAAAPNRAGVPFITVVPPPAAAPPSAAAPPAAAVADDDIPF